MSTKTKISNVDIEYELILLFSTLNDTPFFTLNGGVLA